MVGRWYQVGRYVERSPAQALNWYTKAAGLGSGDAPAYMGYMYLCGDGIPQDYEKARQAFEQGQELASGRAAHALSWLYDRGIGVPRDPERAKTLMQLATKYEFVSDDADLNCTAHLPNATSSTAGE